MNEAEAGTEVVSLHCHNDFKGLSFLGEGCISPDFGLGRAIQASNHDPLLTHILYKKLLIRNSTLRSPKSKKLQYWENITYSFMVHILKKISKKIFIVFFHLFIHQIINFQ